MNWADWTIIAVLTISGLISLRRGFIKEALSLVVWICAFIVAVSFGKPMSELLQEAIMTPSIRQMVAYAILFVATLIIGGVVSFLLSALIEFTGLSGTDRLLGMLFGLMRGVLIVVAAVVFIPTVIPVDQDPWWHQSVLIPHFLELESYLRLIIEEVSNLISNFFSSKPELNELKSNSVSL